MTFIGTPQVSLMYLTRHKRSRVQGPGRGEKITGRVTSGLMKPGDGTPLGSDVFIDPNQLARRGGLPAADYYTLHSFFF